MTSPLLPSPSLRKKIQPELTKAAGALIHGWARRTVTGKTSTPRQVRALAAFLPLTDAATYSALGGADTYEWALKAVDAVGVEDQPFIMGLGEIEVLGLPYGGPNGGKDGDGQFFSPSTDFMDGIIPTPAVMYTHGTQNGFEPEPVGTIKGKRYDRRGGWYKVQLDPTSSRYDQLLNSHAAGKLRASTGVVPASFAVNQGTGHIDSWLVGELSLVDMDDGYKPVNGYAITKATPDILFTDYYGDPVIADEGRNLIQMLKEHLAAMLKLLNGTAVDVADQTDAAGFIDPLYKAEAVKCDPAMNEQLALNTDYIKTEEPMEPETEEKCVACDEAKALGDILKAELAAPPVPAKCARCPEAIGWIRGMVKAGKVTPTEAFTLIDTFTADDSTFDEVRTEVEARTPLGMTKARQDTLELQIAGGTHTDPQKQVDPEHMNKQRLLVGLAVK